MRAARNRLALIASVISLGVMSYSPLCSLSCAAYDCSLLPTTKVASHSEKSGHCHQSDDSEQQPTESQPESNAPEPHGDSSDCPAHTDAIALVSSAVKAPTVVQQSVQPVVSALPGAFYVSFDGVAAKFAEGRPFRSPPKRAVISVYRI